MKKINALIALHRVEIAICILGSFALLSIIVFFEKEFCLFGQCGLWLADRIRARDDLWQLAIAQSSFNFFPFQLPNAAGMPMHGYHYLYSLILFIFGSLGLDMAQTNGLLYPLFWVIAYSYLSYKFIRVITPSRLVHRLFLFLQFFGGSFGYAFTLYHQHSFFMSEGMTYQPVLYLTNKPLSLSILLFLTTLIVIAKTSFAQNKSLLAVSILLFFTWGAKFHTGFALSVWTGISAITQAVSSKISWRRLSIVAFCTLLCSLIAIVLFYRPDLSGNPGQSPLHWSPFALSHSIIESPGMFYLKDMTNARYFLYDQGKFSIRLIGIETLSVALYLFFMVGSRFISIASILSTVIQRRIQQLDVVMVSTVVILLFMMLGFVQNADWFNTMQFFALGLIILNVYTAKTLERIKAFGPLIWYPVLIIFIAITVPYTFATAYSSIAFAHKTSLVIPDAELNALRHLRQLPRGVVFAPIGGVSGIDSEMRDRTLWKHTDVSYITALSGKQTYLSVGHQLSLLGIDYTQRKRVMLNPHSIDFDTLSVDYVYLLKNHPQYIALYKNIGKSKLFAESFDNSDVKLYSRLRP